MSRTTLSVRVERWPAREVLRITGHTFESFDLIVVQVQHGNHIGQGEALGVYYLGETADSLMSAIESVRDAVEAGIDRAALLSLLPPGGARHSLDSALWDLECKRKRQRCWALAGGEPQALQVQITLGIEDSADAMAKRASALARYPHLKLKVDRDDPVARVRAVRQARPDARLVVDANQAWTLDDLKAYADAMSELNVYLIEQPLARGHDEGLDDYRSPVPLCADESCLDASELPAAARRYQFINIKLDKVGGLTAGLALARDARRLGLRLMVGCMGGTSLSMAPAHVLACVAACEVNDLDGPLWLRHDRLPAIDYQDGSMSPFGAQVWG